MKNYIHLVVPELHTRVAAPGDQALLPSLLNSNQYALLAYCQINDISASAEKSKHIAGRYWLSARGAAAPPPHSTTATPSSSLNISWWRERLTQRSSNSGIIISVHMFHVIPTDVDENSTLFSLSNSFVFFYFRRSASVIWTAVSGTEAVIADTKFSGKHLRAWNERVKKVTLLQILSGSIRLKTEQSWGGDARGLMTARVFTVLIDQDQSVCDIHPNAQRDQLCFPSSQFFLLHHVIVVRLSSTAG